MRLAAQTSRPGSARTLLAAYPNIRLGYKQIFRRIISRAWRISTLYLGAVEVAAIRNGIEMVSTKNVLRLRRDLGKL